MKKLIIILLVLFCSICFGGFFQEDIKPFTTNMYDLGTTSLEWQHLFLSGNLDLGTNRITDGTMTGDWNFSGGNLSNIGTFSSTGAITWLGTSIADWTDAAKRIRLSDVVAANLTIDSGGVDIIRIHGPSSPSLGIIFGDDAIDIELQLVGVGLTTLGGNLLVNGGDIGITADTNLLQLASGALTVNGTIGSGAITSTGLITGEQVLIDSNNTEALLVRQNSDALDIFFVDTTNGLSRISQAQDSTTAFSPPVIETGLQIRGFDDRSGSGMQISVDSLGNTQTSTSGTWYLAPDNVPILFMTQFSSTMFDNKLFNFGSTFGNQGSLEWNTIQTSDALMLALNNNSGAGNNGKTLIIHGERNRGFDYGHAAQDHPTMFIHSNNQSQTEWISLTHDGTDGIIDVGTGNLVVDSNEVISGGVLFINETTTPTAIANHGAIYTKNTNQLFFQDGAGTEHLLHGDSFSTIWFHGTSTVEVTISAIDTFTLIDSFTVVGNEDDLGNAVGNISTNTITLSSSSGGEYKVTYHGSITATGGADKEMIFAYGITLATPLDITNVTDDTVTPIVITSTAHGLDNGDMVEIVGVVGNTAANGSFIVDSKADDTFAIVALDGNATTGNGDYNEGSPTGDVTIEYPGQMVVHRMVRGADLGAMSATGIHELANSDVISLYVANVSGTTNLTVAAVSLGLDRIGD